VIRAPRVVASIIAFSAVVGLAARARADITLAAAQNESGWEVYTFGRAGVFVSVLKGDGIPQAYGPQYRDPITGVVTLDGSGNPIQATDMNGRPLFAAIHGVGDGGVRAGPSDPYLAPDGQSGQGPIFASRVRSGFMGNIFGLGVKRALTPWTRLDVVFSIWGTTETEGRRTFYKNTPDWRESYIRVEGPLGTLVLGRALSLFSRGAVEIDFLYGHNYGVGNPADFDGRGPTAGHIGYGVIAPVFVGGVTYATPKFHGLQLTVGYFDPATTVGIYWGRTKFGRPEGELAYDVAAPNFRLHLFASGAWQRLYSLSLAVDANGNSIDERPQADVLGGAGGARVEVGRFHLGVAGHRGRGIGVGYFLDGSDANFAKDTTHELRTFTGAYAQAQVGAGKFDFNAGWGVTWIDALEADKNSNWCGLVPDPTMPDKVCAGYTKATGVVLPASSILKSQMGWSAVVVYHATPNIHIAADYFLSNVKWQQGEQQIVHSYNLGTTVTW
jgi:hypothetical protein